MPTSPPPPVAPFEPMRTLFRRFLTALVSPRVVAGLGRWRYRWRGLAPEVAPALELAAARRLCVIRFDGLGDLVVTTGFLRELRRAAPTAHVTLVVRQEWHSLVEHCPYVDQVRCFRLEPCQRFAALRWHVQAWRFAARQLRPVGFEAVFLPQTHFSYFDLRPAAYLSLAPLRAGWRDAETQPAAGDAACLELLNRVAVFPAATHEADKCYQFLEFLGGRVEERKLELWWPRSEGDVAATTAQQIRGSARVLVAFGLGASQKHKLWPLDRFVQTGRWLMDQHQAAIAAVGGADIQEAAESFARSLEGRVTSLAGRLSVRQTAAFLSRCDLFVGNDSGPMHLAAAGGVPVVQISGLGLDAPPQHYASPGRIGPYGVPCRVVRPRGGGAEIRADLIDAEQVHAAITDLWPALKTSVERG